LGLKGLVVVVVVELDIEVLWARITKPVWLAKPIPTIFAKNWSVFGSKFKFQILREETG
jgi:hypothetical protein